MTKLKGIPKKTNLYPSQMASMCKTKWKCVNPKQHENEKQNYQSEHWAVIIAKAGQDIKVKGKIEAREASCWLDVMSYILLLLLFAIQSGFFNGLAK